MGAQQKPEQDQHKELVEIIKQLEDAMFRVADAFNNLADAIRFGPSERR